MFESARNDDVAVLEFVEPRRDVAEGDEGSLVDNLSTRIGAGVEIGAVGEGVQNVEVALRIKKDSRIDEADDVAQADVGVDDIFGGVFNAQEKLGGVGVG